MNDKIQLPLLKLTKVSSGGFNTDYEQMCQTDLIRLRDRIWSDMVTCGRVTETGKNKIRQLDKLIVGNRRSYWPARGFV